MYCMLCMCVCVLYDVSHVCVCIVSYVHMYWYVSICMYIFVMFVYVCISMVMYVLLCIVVDGFVCTYFIFALIMLNYRIKTDVHCFLTFSFFFFLMANAPSHACYTIKEPATLEQQKPQLLCSFRITNGLLSTQHDTPYVLSKPIFSSISKDMVMAPSMSNPPRL